VIVEAVVGAGPVAEILDFAHGRARTLSPPSAKRVKPAALPSASSR
jgi:hypothetical protein